MPEAAQIFMIFDAFRFVVSVASAREFEC